MNIEIKKIDTAESTNKEASNYWQNVAPDTMVLFYTWNQTNGRGQGNNKWYSEPYKNITATILWKMQQPISLSEIPLFAFSEWLALTICNELSNYLTYQKIKIKWPNDIIIDNKKIGGILIENIIIGQELIAIIGGFGININQEKFPQELTNATSLKLLTQKKYNEKEILMKIFNKIKESSENIIKDKEKIHETYKKYVLTNEIQKGEILKTKEMIEMSIIDIETDGAIIIKTKKGDEIRRYYHHEFRVSY